MKSQGKSGNLDDQNMTYTETDQCPYNEYTISLQDSKDLNMNYSQEY